ncbi:MAG: haloacid dehalogenase type II [Gammaproteobacteria bacterium]|nr:haloacid dehalogenase type II [Gammaproteobacteria bacterium]NNJ83617.1 haloacid dehalogenase type II [Gammaproteobacteria bacterium]
MPITLAFDVYGTLVDTNGVTIALEKHVGNSAPAFSRLWREKQLEYSFRRALMQNYAKFSVCIREALDFTCSSFDLTLNPGDRQALIATYETLPAFDDTEEGLACATENGFRLFAFSNGSADVVERLLGNAGIGGYFVDIVSVDDIKSFKPDPAVYGHFLRSSRSLAATAWLVSGNPFDVMGAISFGMRAAWVRRSPEALFDPWGIEPTLTAMNLVDLAERISTYHENL